MEQYEIMQYLVRLIILFMILPIHECAHAWAAYRLGDDTASYQGRLTLNPIVHLDIVGAVCLMLTGFGWAKPVPVDPARFNRKYSMRFGMAITAAAGPISNLIAALLGMIGLQFYVLTDTYKDALMNQETAMSRGMILWYFLMFFIKINIGLAVFNLLPVPPLDGSKVVGYFTSSKFDRWLMRNQTVISIVFLCVLMTPVLQIPMGFIQNAIYSFLSLLTSWIPLLFG